MMKYLDDLLVLIGEGLIVYATYLLSPVGALYVAGALLIMDGLAIGAAANHSNDERAKK